MKRGIMVQTLSDVRRGKRGTTLNNPREHFSLLTWLEWESVVAFLGNINLRLAHCLIQQEFGVDTHGVEASSWHFISFTSLVSALLARQKQDTCGLTIFLQQVFAFVRVAMARGVRIARRLRGFCYK